MSDIRKVYTGEENGVKKFFAIKYTDNGIKMHLFKMNVSDMTKEIINQLYEWRKTGQHFQLPKHDHIVWDLTVSSSIPDFEGIGRPEDRNQLSREVKKSLQIHYSTLHSEILNSEIKKLKGNVFYLNKNSKKEDFDKYLKNAININHKIKEAKEKNKNQNKGDNWKESLTPKDAYALNQDIQGIFERINSLRKEIETDNLSKLNYTCNQLENEVKSTTDYKKTRENLISFQKSFSDYYLSKESK